MSNLRIVYDNAADRATIAASTTAGSLAVSNLQTDFKTEVWRSTATIATLECTWANSVMVGVVAFPICSFSPSATVRVRCYTEAADTTPVYDSGAQLACPPIPFEVFNWGYETLGVNTYSYGGGTYGTVWIPITSAKKVVIDIDDSTNTLGYIEASRLVIGSYWTPTNNADYGAQITVQDTSKSERSDSGDLRTDRGTLHKVVSFDLGMMDAGDRNSVWNIAKGNGLYRPMFVSLTPEATDTSEEQIYQVYGKLSKQSSIRYQYVNQFNTTLEIEEI